jgi:copper chaperone CopZ
MSQTILTITGMACGGCVASVQSVLAALPGVQGVQVTLDPPAAVVDHDPATAPPEKLIQAVVDAGFGASV